MTSPSSIDWIRRTAVLFIIVFSTWSNNRAIGAPVAVVNGGFEDITGESPFNEFTFGELNGWDLYDPDVITSDGDGPTFFIGTLTPFEPDPIGSPDVYEFFPDGAAEGQRVGIAFNYFGSGDVVNMEWFRRSVIPCYRIQPTHWT